MLNKWASWVVCVSLSAACDSRQLGPQLVLRLVADKTLSKFFLEFFLNSRNLETYFNFEEVSAFDLSSTSFVGSRQETGLKMNKIKKSNFKSTQQIRENGLTRLLR